VPERPTDQRGFAYRFDWGPNGLRALAPVADVVVLVDVLSFTTAVEVAVSRGATVLPYRWDNGSEAAFAAERGAVLAGRRGSDSWSLSPAALRTIPPGTRLVLPSPNGSALAFAAAEAGAHHVLAGCLRNATATARVARRLAGDGVVAVVAAGERWRGDTGPLRVAVEDLLGAGAVLAALDPAAARGAPGCSPEAGAARAAFVTARALVSEWVAASVSGRELIEAGWVDDVAVASVVDASDVVPVLRGDTFRAWSETPESRGH
jgi:2-phosphosulfolactate phosphatase